jgi:DNA-binding transcriptional LysR family regulator
VKQRLTVRQGALDGIEAFLAVARHKSFRKGADALGVTPSAVSQAVRSLESKLGVALFARTTRSVGFTEAGQRLLQRAAPAFDELAAATRAAQDLGQGPSGLLRVSVPRGVMPLIVQPLIASFCREHPAIELEISASEEMVDIAAQGFDAGIRMGQYIEADMTAVRLTPPFPLLIVAAPGYLRSRGTPKRAGDLREHACLRLRRSSGAIATWPLIQGGKPIEVVVSGPLIANDFPTLVGAACDGVGLAQVPGPMVLSTVEAGALVSVLPKSAVMTPGVYLYHPGRKQVLPKLRAFIDHVKAGLERLQNAA